MNMPGTDIKKLGFGLMRLPRQGDEIDVEQTKKMVDRFLEEGFTYFDTAHVYSGSEEATRKALVERHPRASFHLATKIAPWLQNLTREQALAQFETSLQKTGAGYFDFYLLHNLGGNRTPVFEDFGIWDFAQEKKAAGLIRHIGFSFHSTADELDAILKKHPEAEFVQLQINYADWENASVQSRRCYEVARAHGKPVIIMEPVKGGLLANPPAAIRELFSAANPDLSYAGWAIRFAASLDGVLTVLSGMSSLEQMEDNLSYMKSFSGMTDAEQEVIRKAREILASTPIVPCTNCDYCAKVCPEQIGISGSFAAFNHWKLFQNAKSAKHLESWQVGGRGRKSASACIQCGACEAVCPQHISIREELKKVSAFLSSTP